MAEKLTDAQALEKAQQHLGSGEPGPGHNSKELTPAQRRKLIRDVAGELAGIDGEIKQLQEKRAKIKNEKVKGTLGMKTSDFNLALRLHKLEGDDRTEALDTLRECYEALTKGDQLNWLDAVEGDNDQQPGD